MNLMMRAGLWAVVLAATTVLSGFRSERPFVSGDPSSEAAAEPLLTGWVERYLPVFRQHAPGLFPVVDTSAHPRVLMLNYSAYDSAYANKVQRIISRQIPGARCTHFWDGGEAELLVLLEEQDAVVVVYPSGGDPARIELYGRLLEQFAARGGVVVFTGTHTYKVLQHFGLLKLGKGYFCKEPLIELGNSGKHPLQEGIPARFRLDNYAYPLDLADTGFCTLAEVQGFPVLGVKSIGAGQVVYIGLEYYYDEPVSSRIMVNAVLSAWHPAAAEEAPDAGLETARPSAQPSTEFLYAGSGHSRAAAFDLKVYPNPYLYKATLEVELQAQASVAIEMTDESGRLVSTLLPRKTLQQGSYRFELPDVATGIYFLRYSQNDQHTVRKIVKMEAP